MNGSWPQAIADGWHPLASMASLGRRPIARRVMDVSLVLFRGQAGPVVLRDRCPHRAMPLSLGRVEDGGVTCSYHGWRFGMQGRCLAVPGADTVPEISADAFPVVERAGLVWTSLAAQPAAFPALPVVFDDAALDRFWWLVEPSQARVLDAIENHVDPAHPHYLHPGLVRGWGPRRPVKVRLRIGPQGAEATYEENSRTQTWWPRLLEGTRARSIGRYYPPTIGQVVFENKNGFALSIAVVFVPERSGITRPFAHFATPRGLLPAWFKRWALKAFHVPVLSQDRRALARQAASIADSGGARYTHGPLDFLGPTIWKLAHGMDVPMEEQEAVIAL